jgi:hypothetical protein
VVVVLAEDLSATAAESGALAELAARGRRFDRAYSQ